MTATVDKLPFALGITAPKHKNDMLPMVIEYTDSRVGEFFPTFVLMTAWVVCFNGQCGIEEQDTLIRPTLEIPRRGYRLAQIAVNLLVDIHQRWWNRHTVIDRETESVRLTDIVVRVLPDDDNAHVVERTRVESIKNQTCRRKALMGLIGVAHKRGQQLEIRFVELGLQYLTPTFFYFNLHKLSLL